MTEAINMALVSMKPSLFDGDPSLAFYNRAADISVFVCTSPTVHDQYGNYYKVTVVGNLDGLSDDSIGDYARSAWLELMPVGHMVLEVTHVQEDVGNGIKARHCIVTLYKATKH
jgi:hypothetical protein